MVTGDGRMTPEGRAAALLLKHGVTSVPVPVEDIAASEGFKIGRDRYDGPEYGFTLRDGSDLIIGVNTNTSPRRQRCAVAHCLGHGLMHQAVILVCRTVRTGVPDAPSVRGRRRRRTRSARPC